MDPLSWATPGPCQSGTYYEGWVGEILQLHSQETVTCNCHGSEMYQSIWMCCREISASRWAYYIWPRKWLPVCIIVTHDTI